MSGRAFSTHALARMAQRGISEDDLDLINLIATETADGLYVRERDGLEFERDLR